MSKKQVQVVMLPSNEGFNPGLLKYQDRLKSYIAGGELRKLIHYGATPQHLYFTSNEEIKEGDYFLSDFKSFVLQNKEGGVNGYPNVNLKDNLKIIATTDKSLNLPLIPQSFIEEYVESNGEIKEVDLLTNCERRIDGLDYVALYNEEYPNERKQTLEEAAQEFNEDGLKKYLSTLPSNLNESTVDYVRNAWMAALEWYSNELIKQLDE